MTSAAAAGAAADLPRLVARLSRLVDISVTLNSTLDLDRLLEFIIRTAAELVESEGAAILLVDENTHDLFFAASTGSDPQELAKIPVPMEGSIAGTVFRQGRPLILNHVADDPRHFRQVGEKIKFETRSLLGVPMRIRDKVTGVLEAVNKRQGAFDETDSETLSIIASQAAVAIHNARLVSALQGAYQELGQLDRLKADFIAIASHELRTPLGVILGYAAILREEAKEAAASEQAETVLNSALRMRALIEDMTNMNLMQVGRAEMSFEVHPLADVVQIAHDEVAPLIRAKGQTLIVRRAEDPLPAPVDRAKLAMAVTNLLNNAMRFTPAQGHILLELTRHGAEGWIRVRDDGVGIPADQLERIFDRFYQVENHMTRRHQGMGLGLAIVRAIAQAHGGRVWAESEGRDLGSTFTVAVPLKG
ncbi:MAG TPA: GAF domain-containing sensor histidine kinase [Anaerolineales bacterium]